MNAEEMMYIGNLLHDLYNAGVELKAICDEYDCDACPCKCGDSPDCWIEKNFGTNPNDWEFYDERYQMNAEEMMYIGNLLHDLYNAGVELKAICDEYDCDACPCKCGDSPDCWIEKNFGTNPNDWEFYDDM